MDSNRLSSCLGFVEDLLLEVFPPESSHVVNSVACILGDSRFMWGSPGTLNAMNIKSERMSDVVMQKKRQAQRHQCVICARKDDIKNILEADFSINLLKPPIAKVKY